MKEMLDDASVLEEKFKISLDDTEIISLKTLLKKVKTGEDAGLVLGDEKQNFENFFHGNKGANHSKKIEEVVDQLGKAPISEVLESASEDIPKLQALYMTGVLLRESYRSADHGEEFNRSSGLLGDVIRMESEGLIYRHMVNAGGKGQSKLSLKFGIILEA